MIIEDDPIIGEQVKAGLETEGFKVTLCWEGSSGLQSALSGDYGLVILDLMLPGRDGWRICERLRAARIAVPILILSARDAIEDRVRGLECGADDYLSKPFDFRELVARARAAVRRQALQKSQIIHIADVQINTADGSVRRNGQIIALTPHEYALLEAFARNPGRILSRTQIQERIWGDDESFSNVVSYHISLLRKKIDAGRKRKLIHTIYGFGYVLRLPEDDSELHHAELPN